MWHGIASQSKVLICPLDWGLGHAARSIALAAQLRDHNCSVHWAAPKVLHQFIIEHFPEATIFSLPAYQVHYSSGNSQVGSMIKQWPKIQKAILAENRAIHQIVEAHQFDVIVSDHRYGCHYDKVKSVFLAHQLQILMPDQLKWFQRIFNSIHRYQIKSFDEIWIPDFSNQSLSGKLSDFKTKMPQRWIGPLSRFSFQWPQKLASFPFDLKQLNHLLIASGPEPHRSQLINQTKKEFVNLPSINLIVSGSLGETQFTQLADGLWQVNHLNTESLKLAIDHAEQIVCRSGYSSIMDLFVLEKTAHWIPTPGQTEQMYLAQKHKNLNSVIETYK